MGHAFKVVMVWLGSSRAVSKAGQGQPWAWEACQKGWGGMDGGAESVSLTGDMGILHPLPCQHRDLHPWAVQRWWANISIPKVS